MGALNYNDLHIYVYALVCAADLRIRIVKIRMNPFQNPVFAKAVSYTSDVLTTEVMGKFNPS
jgi:hypothetical protein